MEVPGHAPLLSVHDFGIEVTAIVQVDVVRESCQTEHLRCRERVPLVEEDLPLKMAIQLIDFWLALLKSN